MANALSIIYKCFRAIALIKCVTAAEELILAIKEQPSSKFHLGCRIPHGHPALVRLL